MIDWDSTEWGNPESCVHYSESGSWVRDRHADD